MSDENVIIVALSQDHKALELFQDPNNEECNYPTLFFGILRKPSILAKFQYQDITQWELMHKEHRFPKHIPNLFFKAIKVFIQQVKSASWIIIWKRKLNDRILTTKQVTNKLNLDKLLWLDLEYHNLTHLRTSPDYLEKLLKYAFAMIR